MSNIIEPKLMNKITDRIYIGSYHAATMLDYGNRESITHVLNITPDPHEGLKDLEVVQINIHDGNEIPPETVMFGIRTIENAVKNNGRILVHCHAGISRSTSFVIGYLMYCGFSWDEGLRFVSERRPQAWPHPKIELSIKKALGLALSPATTLLGGDDGKSTHIISTE